MQTTTYAALTAKGFTNQTGPEDTCEVWVRNDGWYVYLERTNSGLVGTVENNTADYVFSGTEEALINYLGTL
jgi:hypothetical protein